VGIIFLVARVWDAINDPLFGIIVDRSHLKGGKYKPWLKLSSYLIPVFTLAMFAIPSGFPIALKTGLAAVLYICWGMSYTVCDIPIFSVVTAITGNTNERNRIISYGRIAFFGGSVVIGIIVPLLYPKIGWFPTVAIVSIAGVAAMLPLGYVAQERHKSENSESPTLKAIIRAVSGNKFLMVLFFASFAGALTNTAVAVTGYFAINNLGGPEMMVFLNILPLGLVVVLAMFTTAMTKKVDKFVLYISSIGINIVFSVIMFFAGYDNIPLFLILYTIRTVGLYYQGIIGSMFYIDCAEYGMYKTGKNATAVTMSLSTFGAKAFMAIAGSLAMFILGIAGFISGSGVVQPPSVISALWIMMSILPAASQVVCFCILLFGYKLKERDVQIMIRINQGEISRAEGESLFSRKY
jgi:Na+/melibiose symporter-like transporter